VIGTAVWSGVFGRRAGATAGWLEPHASDANDRLLLGLKGTMSEAARSRRDVECGRLAARPPAARLRAAVQAVDGVRPTPGWL
jgi:hypothetical protein